VPVSCAFAKIVLPPTAALLQDAVTAAARAELTDCARNTLRLAVLIGCFS
jgi:hypothetical protein